LVESDPVKPAPEIDSWLSSRKPPAAEGIRRVREIILQADKRMTEYIKYGTLNFGYVSDFAVFVQRDKKQVRLMFHRGRGFRVGLRTWRDPTRARGS
jgi:hypothetical protein